MIVMDGGFVWSTIAPFVALNRPRQTHRGEETMIAVGHRGSSDGIPDLRNVASDVCVSLTIAVARKGGGSTRVLNSQLVAVCTKNYVCWRCRVRVDNTSGYVHRLWGRGGLVSHAVDDAAPNVV